MKWRTYKQLSMDDKIEWEFRFKNKDDDIAHGFMFSLIVTILTVLIIGLVGGARSAVMTAALFIVMFTSAFVISAAVLKYDEYKWIKRKMGE